MKMLKLCNMESGSWQRPISLEIQKSEIVLLLGRNGVGKTTLLNTIAGLVPVKSGQIEFEGQNITHIDEYGRCQLGIRIALEGRQLFPRLSVRKNLLLGAFSRSKEKGLKDDLDWVLTVFPGLQCKLDQPVGFLSGGQQTQVNLGRALMGKPRLLLLDEPALGLDPSNVKALIDVIHLIRKERDVTAVIAEQNGYFAKAFPERVLIVVGGKILFDGNYNDAVKENKLSFIIA